MSKPQPIRHVPLMPESEIEHWRRTVDAEILQLKATKVWQDEQVKRMEKLEERVADLERNSHKPLGNGSGGDLHCGDGGQSLDA